MLKLYKSMWICGAILLIGFLVLSPQRVRAEAFIAQGGATTVVLTSEACTSEKVRKAHPNLDLKNHWTARVTHQGRFIEACWTANTEQGTVEIVDAEGDSGSLMMSLFRKLESL